MIIYIGISCFWLSCLTTQCNLAVWYIIGSLSVVKQVNIHHIGIHIHINIHCYMCGLMMSINAMVEI